MPSQGASCTVEKYRALVDEQFKKSTGSVTVDAAFPKGSLGLTGGAIILLVVLSAVSEAVAEVAPEAATLTAFVGLYLIIDWLNGRRAYGRLRGPINKCLELVDGADRVAVDVSGVDVSFRLEGGPRGSTLLDFPASRVTAFDVGMGHYLRLEADGRTMIVPKGLVSGRTFKELWDPYGRLHAAGSGLSGIPKPDLENLRHQFPFLIQRAGHE